MTKLSHMVLPVTDVGKSRDWYVNNLDFKLEFEREGVAAIKDTAGRASDRQIAVSFKEEPPNSRCARSSSGIPARALAVRDPPLLCGFDAAPHLRAGDFPSQ